MKRLAQIGITFMKSNKMLTLSAFLSIFVACFLSISMFQVSSNVEQSIERGMEAQKGAFDLQITKNEGKSFSNEEIKSLQQERNVKKTSGGYQTNDFLDIYMVGVVDDAINKSLYKYTKDVKGNSVIINDSLSQRENKKVGDVFSINGKNFKIAEVVKPDSMSDYKMPMVIMELSQIHQLLGHKNTKQINYMLLQCTDAAYDSIEYGGGLARSIASEYPDCQVTDQRGGDSYNTKIKNIKMIFKIFFGVVLLISGLFVVNIFMEYMRKYRKDMAVIRTVGGTQKQVEIVFNSMSVIISAGACLAGALFSALVSGITLNWFNDKVQLFEENFSLNLKELWLITVIVFTMFNFFVYWAFQFGQSVLPIQVFQQTVSGLKKNKRANRFLALRKIFGKSGYLGIKLMLPKFRQNFMLILIIALITALSYTGQVSLKLLNANGEVYNSNLVQGKTARGLLETDTTIPLSLSYVKKIYKRFQPVMGNGYMLYGSFDMVEDEDDGADFCNFKVSDLEKIPQLLYADIWEKYEDVPKTKRLIMGDTIAKEKGYKLGDTVTLNSDYLGGKRDFILVETVKKDTAEYNLYNVIVDWDCLSDEKWSKEYLDEEQTTVKYWDMCLGLWLDGDKEQIREKFQQLQLELDTSFKWIMYDDIVEDSKHMGSQWTTTLHVVLNMLLIVAGIGLLNSANGMLLTRRNEYQILRMLGTTERDVRKICWMQVLSFMISGVVIGAILGIIVVAIIWTNNVATHIPLTIEWEYIAVIVIYLLSLSLTLYPTVKKMGR